VHLAGFIIRIYHEARSSECQIRQVNHYTVKLFVFDISISIKVKNQSLPDIRLYEHFVCFYVKNSYVKSAQALQITLYITQPN